MRIALICDWYAPRLGGIETHLSELGNRLTARGHDVHVITSTPGPARDGSVHVHRLGEPLLPGAKVVFRPSAIRRIGELLRAHRIEVAHSHVSIVAPVGIGGGVAAYRLSIPSVVTFHSFVPATPVWAWAAGRLAGASRWNAIFSAVSSLVAREVAPFTGGEIRVLSNGVDTDFWSAGMPPHPAAVGGGSAGHRPGATGPIRLISVGRLQSKKRPMLLLDAVTHIRAIHPAIRTELVIVGEGPLGEAMRRRADRLGVRDRIHFAGRLPPTEVRERLRQSHMFLSPAVRESFGIAALEARSVGLPVVAMSGSAVSDFVEHDRSGLLASSDDEFMHQAARLASEHGLRNRLAIHNTMIPTDLTWNRTLDSHELIYREAMGSVA